MNNNKVKFDAQSIEREEAFHSPEFTETMGKDHPFNLNFSYLLIL